MCKAVGLFGGSFVPSAGNADDGTKAKTGNELRKDKARNEKTANDEDLTTPRMSKNTLSLNSRKSAVPEIVDVRNFRRVHFLRIQVRLDKQGYSK